MKVDKVARNFENIFYRVSGGVETGQQLAVDECLGVVDHQEHDDLGD